MDRTERGFDALFCLRRRTKNPGWIASWSRWTAPRTRVARRVADPEMENAG